MPDSKSNPYVSIVATSRNDNHGGDLLQRMQVFVDSTARLAQQFEVPVELLLVEWNPPEDRPALVEALNWPDSNGYCSYRIVEVPPELHAELDTAESLPLYQMIAKNVGIRRAAAPFILATNVDIIPSEQLFAWLQQRKLRKRHIYRADRYDVATEVIGVQGIDQQLEFCRNNLLRVNCRFGTFPLEGISADQVAGQPSLNALVRAEIKRRVFARLKTVPGSMARKIGKVALDVSLRSLVRFAGRSLSALRKPFYWFAGSKTARVNSRLVIHTRRWIKKLVSRHRMKHLAAASYHLIPYFKLHTNACGDFTLMAKSDWERLRGYAEFEMYSWHLDSLLVLAAYHAGFIEEVVPHPVYHIEHTGGWSPDSAEQLFAKLKQRGIPCMTNGDLENYEWEMSRTLGAYHLNEDHWGFANCDLPDYIVDPQTAPVNTLPAEELSVGAAA